MNANDSHQEKEIDALVLQYESSSKNGQALFLDESSFFKLIEFYHDEDRLKEAMEVVDLAIERHLFSVDFYLKKAELLIEAGDEQLALSILDKAESFAPGQLDILLLKAEALTYMDRGGEALELLDNARAVNDETTQGELYLLESLVHEFHQDYEKMFYVLKNAIKIDPENEEILERIWVAVELSRKYKQSITLHKQIIDKQPYSYMAWYNLGHAYAYLGNYKDAIEAYEYAFIINEKFEYAIRDCADLCFETGQFKKAIKYYLELFDDAEADSDLFQRVGECYQQLGNFDHAATYFRKAISRDSLNDEGYFRLGECYAHNSHWKEAARYYDKALQIDDQREEYYSAMGVAKAELGDVVLAEDFFRKSVELAPEESKYWFEYTSFLIGYDRVEDALSLLVVAEITADACQIQFGQAACLFQLGRRKEACRLLWHIMEEDGDHYRVMFDLFPELEHDVEIHTILSSYID